MVAPGTKVDSGRRNFPGSSWIICHTGLVDAFGTRGLEEVIQGVNLSWRSNASCRGLDPAIFYPASEEDAAEAKAVCAGCVVREACLEYALVNRERDGVWGGATEKERRRIHRHRRKTA